MSKFSVYANRPKVLRLSGRALVRSSKSERNLMSGAYQKVKNTGLKVSNAELDLPN